MIEHKEYRLDTVTTDAGSFEGYASVFGLVDRVGDVVMPGAYTKTLPTFLLAGVVHWSHDFNTPVAWPTAAREDARGLFLAGTFHKTQAGQNARTVTSERLAAGMSMGLSIGYKVEDYAYRDDGVRELHEIELLEVSLVTLPALAEATVTDVKCVDCLGQSQTAASQCPDSQSLSLEDRKSLESIYHRVLDMELDRTAALLTYRRELAANYAENSQDWSEVPISEVCPQLRMRAETALLDAAVDLWIAPPPLKFFAEKTSIDAVAAFTAPALWGTFRDGAIWISDSPGHDVRKTVAHEMAHAARAGMEELLPGNEEAYAAEYADRAAARWNQ